MAPGAPRGSATLPAMRGRVTMRRRARTHAVQIRYSIVICVVAACGGHATPAAGPPSASPEESMMQSAASMSPSAEDTYAPLDVGADFATYREVTHGRPFLSRVHGNRWVDVFV